MQQEVCNICGCLKPCYIMTDEENSYKACICPECLGIDKASERPDP